MNREFDRHTKSAAHIPAPDTPIPDEIYSRLIFLCEATYDPLAMFPSDRLTKPIGKNDRTSLSHSEQFLRAYLASPRTFVWVMAHLNNIYERFSVITRALENENIRFKDGTGRIVTKPTQHATTKEILGFLDLQFGQNTMGKSMGKWSQAVKQCRHRLVKTHKEIDEFLRTWL